MQAPRTTTVLVGLVTALLALPAVAQANDFQNVYREYKRTGTIKPCRFSDKQLQNAQHETPPDVEQYAPSFLDALQAAREAGASCHKKAAAHPVPAPAPPPTPSAPAPVPTTPAAAPVQPATPPAPPLPAQPALSGVASPPLEDPKRSESAPAAVWLLAALGALALLAAALGALAWWRGWGAERWTRPLRAAFADFGERLSDLRLEFADWLRTGH